MEEVGGDHVWDERRGLFLENHGDDVISYVAFPLQLKEEQNIHLTCRPGSLSLFLAFGLCVK